MSNQVRVNMRGTAYYRTVPGQPKERFGPGQGILVPEGLARSLGLAEVPEPVAAQAEAVEEAEPQAGANDDGGKGAQAGDTANSERDAREDDEEPSLEGIDGIGPELAGELAAQGITTIAQFRGAGDARLLDIPGIGPATLKKLRAATEGQ